MAVVSACATGSNSLGEAFEMIVRGAADAIIAGGAEAATNPLIIAGFNVMGALSAHNDNPAEACRPFDLHRDGFVMSEGSVVLVLEELEHAKKRNAKILAEFIGYGTSVDANHMASPLEDGAGAALAMRRATLASSIRSPRSWTPARSFERAKSTWRTTLRAGRKSLTALSGRLTDRAA